MMDKRKSRPNDPPGFALTWQLCRSYCEVRVDRTVKVCADCRKRIDARMRRAEPRLQTYGGDK